jgi:hypothetical protein
VWCYATPDVRAWWADLWAERVTKSALADQALEYGIATRAELIDMAAGFHAWGAAPDGYFTLTHGELLARP